MSCPACGGEAWVAGYPACPELGRWPHRRCGACGLWAVDPLPADLAGLNEALYGGTDSGRARPVGGRARRWLARVRAQCARPHAHLLDVGCGDGAFVAAAGEAGFNAEGVEPAAGPAARARRAGLAVVTGTLADLPAGEVYDVIRLQQVVEHVADPCALLRDAARRLRPGGVVYLATPNTDGLAHRVLRAEWRHLGGEHNGHLRLFGPRALGEAARAAGLEVVDLQTRGLRAWSRASPGGVRRLGWRLIERVRATWPGELGDVLHAELRRAPQQG